jgi:flagellar hook-length control protein FliK
LSSMSVLSDILKESSKLEKITSPKEKNVADCSENVAAVFAALFSSFMTANVNLKGLSSALVNQDAQAKQSNVNPVQINQHPNVAGSILGYGNFLFPFLTQMMLPSDSVAQEANSGESVSPGIEKLSIANEKSFPAGRGAAGKELELALLKLVFLASNEDLASTGLTTRKLPGDNRASTELAQFRQVLFDKYGQVIIDLLGALAGKISDSTSQGTRLGAESGQGSQELLKIIHNQFNYQFKNIGADAKSRAAGAQETALLTNNQQQSEGLMQGFQDKISSPIPKEHTKADYLKSDKFAENINKEVQKLELVKSLESAGIKDGQSQSSIGAGVTVNDIQQPPLAAGKIVWLPLWEQIAGVVREQVLNRQQNLKELDIQLQPENLGKIRIFLRWEGGQVHLQVNASEAATGQLLQSQLPELRQNLLDQGVNCGSLQMGQNGEHQPERQGEQTNNRSHHNYSLPNEDEVVIPVLNPISYGLDGINRINVTA